MQPIRQGDVILLPVEQVEGKNLSHLTKKMGSSPGPSLDGFRRGYLQRAQTE